MSKRIELHELIKLGIHLGIMWETKTAYELEQEILAMTNCSTVFDAINEQRINRSCPTQMYLTVWGEP